MNKGQRSGKSERKRSSRRSNRSKWDIFVWLARGRVLRAHTDGIVQPGVTIEYFWKMRLTTFRSAYFTRWIEMGLARSSRNRPDPHPKHLSSLSFSLQRFILTQVHILSCRRGRKKPSAPPCISSMEDNCTHRHTQHALPPITTDGEGLPLSVRLLFISHRALPPHSPSQPTPQRNADVGKTPYMHRHTHTHTFLCSNTHMFFMSHTDTYTQLVSQLTHSLLFWVILEPHCQGDDRGNFPLVEKLQRAVNAKQSHAFTRENPSFPFCSAFSAASRLDSRSGHPFRKGQQGQRFL